MAAVVLLIWSSFAGGVIMALQENVNAVACCKFTRFVANCTIVWHRTGQAPYETKCGLLRSLDHILKRSFLALIAIVGVLGFTSAYAETPLAVEIIVVEKKRKTRPFRSLAKYGQRKLSWLPFP